MYINWYQYRCRNCDYETKSLHKILRRCKFCGRYMKFVKVNRKIEV